MSADTRIRIALGVALVFVVALVVFGAVATRPGEQKAKTSDTVTVRITGDPGLQFSGSYGTARSGQQRVDGTTPTEFEVEQESGAFSDDILSVTAQKIIAGSDELRIQIVRGGEVVKEQATTAQFGVVTLTI
jgi:hypothetical protein